MWTRGTCLSGQLLTFASVMVKRLTLGHIRQCKYPVLVDLRHGLSIVDETVIKASSDDRTDRNALSNVLPEVRCEWDENNECGMHPERLESGKVVVR